MDWTALAASGLTFVLGIAAVSKFLGTFLPQTVKYVKIAKDAISLLEDITESLRDGALTQEEIEKLKSDVELIKEDFN